MPRTWQAVLFVPWKRGYRPPAAPAGEPNPSNAKWRSMMVDHSNIGRQVLTNPLVEVRYRHAADNFADAADASRHHTDMANRTPGGRYRQGGHAEHDS